MFCRILQIYKDAFSINTISKYISRRRSKWYWNLNSLQNYLFTGEELDDHGGYDIAYCYNDIKPTAPYLDEPNIFDTVTSMRNMYYENDNAVNLTTQRRNETTEVELSK